MKQKRKNLAIALCMILLFNSIPSNARASPEYFLGPLDGTLQGTGYDHAGIDIHAPAGTPIYAIGSGTISYSELGHTSSYAGFEDIDTRNSVKICLDEPIEYEGKQYTNAFYTHMSSLVYHVASDSPQSDTIHVEEGALIGYSGYGRGVAHLHLSLEWVNPQNGNDWSHLSTPQMLEVMGWAYGQSISAKQRYATGLQEHPYIALGFTGARVFPLQTTGTVGAAPTKNETNVLNKVSWFDAAVTAENAPRITSVFSDGWCMVRYWNDELGEYVERYTKLAYFIYNINYEPRRAYCQTEGAFFARQDLTIRLGTAAAGSEFLIVSEGAGSYYQAFWKNEGDWLLGWIDKAVIEHSHSYGVQTITKQSTCTEPGIAVATCTAEGCGAQETISIPALGHDFSGSYFPDAPPYEEYQICTRCGVTQKTGYVRPPELPVEGELLGDINGDDTVDSDDVIALMRFSIYPEQYLVAYRGKMDFNHDGNIDIEDVTRLMRYSVYPEIYPLQ